MTSVETITIQYSNENTQLPLCSKCGKVEARFFTRKDGQWYGLCGGCVEGDVWTIMDEEDEE